jgi:hypothetical protein
MAYASRDYFVDLSVLVVCSTTAIMSSKKATRNPS